MCSKYIFPVSVDPRAAAYGFEHGDKVSGRRRTLVEAMPGSQVPILFETEDLGTVARRTELAHWGLVRPRSKRFIPKSQPITVRAETVATSEFTRETFALRRCILPANGHFEWRPSEIGNEQYFIQIPGTGAALAGIYEMWRPLNSSGYPRGRWRASVAVLTREQNDALGEKSWRAPIPLAPRFHNAWLSSEKTKADGALELLEDAREFNAHNMVVHRSILVSR
ncbi:SOS response-associated peptidase family protein [Pseudarthrobacter sp. SSS035]|uniref:SOS response-associated peptidase family protein n=1 Tax=Pseudarthrobacter sp. SSS035 TaxID=2931399 RepID=UPI00200CEB17|nr:SOS response-associated peptidase family protein [Pseudarthrobacter sp. SSS035]